MDQESIHLVERCREGDSDASHELFDRYVSRLIAVIHRRMSSKLARRVDAEDVVQSAFRSFFHGVDQDEFEFQQTGDLWRLLVTIALNKLRRKAAYHGAAKRKLNAERSAAAFANDDSAVANCLEVAAATPLPDAEAAVADELRVLTEGFEPRNVTVVELRLQGFEMTEIAEQVDCSERTVRRVLEKVRERWQDRLAESMS